MSKGEVIGDIQNLKKNKISDEINKTKINLDSKNSIEKLKERKIGDIVYLTGRIVSARDKAHFRIVELLRKQKIDEIPEEVFSYPIYHCGPLMCGKNILSAGPTTSARMNAFAPYVLEVSNFPVIIGKGGMNDTVVKFLKNRGCYLTFPGGAGALAAKKMTFEKVYWEDLGMAEAVYVFKVENFGPCIVSIDSKGRNIHKEVSENAEKIFLELYKS